MFWSIFGIVTCIKVLLIPSYRSTDFEVHRNWMAITHSLPMSKWYYEDTSEWTLDYPPMFAYFEFLLSLVARIFDPNMLTVENLNYASRETVLFQRFSVIITDIVYAIGAKRCAEKLKFGEPAYTVATAALVSNFGLLIIDHIHFQYNGVLFGILLLSISYMAEEKFLKSAFFFAVLLCMKHIFVYISPVYIVYLLKIYCFRSTSYYMMFRKLTKLAVVTLSVVYTAFYPFREHIPQVLSRLFPFKRGLCHAYWAPNFWALYNVVDKAGAFVFRTGTHTVSNTGGLVQDTQHQFLPNVPPVATFVLTMLAMIPFICRLISKPYNKATSKYDFIHGIVICACTSFLFGWHVHEKAILMTVIPMSLLMVLTKFHSDTMMFLTAIASYSLLPLIFTSELLLIKCCLYVINLAVLGLGFSKQSPAEPTVISFLEKRYCVGLIVPFAYEMCFQYLLRLDERLPFLPLLLTSVYCSVGIMYFWIKLYANYLFPHQRRPEHID